MAEQVNGIGLDVDNGLFEVGATLPQAGSWSIGCDVTIEDVDASVQEVRVNDISLSGSLAIPEVPVDIDANNDKVMDLEIGIATSGLSTGITESQIVPYDKIVKITEFSPESINERKYASSALAAKRIYDLIKEGGAGLNEDELKAFLKKYGYVTEEYVNELLKDVSSFFYLSEDGQSIGTPYNIFSEKEISANGLSVGSGGSGGGEGGGLIRTVLTSSSLGSVTSNDNFTTFNAFAIDSIYKKVKSIEEGNVSLSNYYTKSESDARFALLSSLTTVEEKIREILSWFTIDDNGNLRTEFNLYSTKEISAGGFNGTCGSTGGGLISTVLGIDKFGTVTTNSNTSTFNAYAIDSLHKRIKNLEESEVDLTGYATEEWVMGRGFITASALAPYLKTSDFETWKTGSFNPVVSQVNTNKNNIAEILKWFAIDGDGNLYTTYNFYSTKEISSGGFDSGSNGTGGLIGVVYGKSAFGTIANEANNATFNAYAIDSLYKRIVSLENKEVDLTGYATEAWVAGQGFITLAALSPYMKTADANDTFATKTALNNLSSSHDSLAKRVSTAEGNISTHTTQISGLTTRMGNAETNISTNAKGIADNKTAIATNKNNISANTTAITNLGKKVTANEGNIAEILKWFAVDSDGNLYTTYNFYSTKEISANGLSIGSGGSGGGLISQVFGTTAFGTIAAESNSATFNAYAIDSLYKRIVSLEGKATAVSFVPALTSGKQIGTLSIDGVSTVLYGVDAYSKTEADGRYLKLSGGEVNGYVNFSHATQSIPLGVQSKSTDYVAIRFTGGTGNSAYLVYSGNGDEWAVTPPNWAGSRILLHSGNYNSYALPLSGGTISNGNNGTPLVIDTTHTEIGVPFRINNINKGWVGHTASIGTYLYDYTSKKFIGVKTDGTPVYYDGSHRTLYHTGNFNPANYLPVSGGTISGSGDFAYVQLRIKGASIPNIMFEVGSSEKGAIGWAANEGMRFTNAAAGASLGIKDNGTPYFNGNTLIHSGNIGSQSVASADVIATAYANQSIDLGREGKVRMIYGTASNATSLGYPRQYTSGLSVLTGYTGWQMVTYGGTRIPNPYFRSLTDNGTFSDWKQLAFLTDNVASATKLATARTIWGQSFDGTGDIDGNLVQSIDAYGTSPTIYHKVHGSTANRYCALKFRFNAYDYFAGLDIESNNGVLTTINSSGNVTIGSSDLAGTTANLAVKNILRVNDASMNAILNIANEGGDINYVHLFVSSANSSNATTRPLVLQNGYGNVGIGINNPQYKLHINGTARVGDTLSVANALTVATNVQIPINGDRITFCSATGTYTKGIIAMNTSNTYLEAPLATDSASGAKPAILIGWRGCSVATGTTNPYPITITSGGIALNGTTAINGTLKNVNNIYPNSAGERYIGTSTNPFKYMYAEWYGAGTGQALSFGANNATHIWVDTYGRVGIGTTSPQSRLDVDGDININNRIYTPYVFFGRNEEGLYMATNSISWHNSSNNYKSGLFGFRYNEIIAHQSITANSGVKVASGQAITFLDASGKEHKLTYDSTAGAFKFDGNILVVGDGQFNAIN